MEEQITIEQKKPGLSAILDPKKLLLGALACLLLAAFIGFIPSLISVLANGIEAEYATRQLVSSFSYILQDVLNGLILPLVLFLLLTNTNKAKLSKIFFIVAIVFVVVQIFTAIVLVVNSFRGQSGLLEILLQWVPGGGLLSALVYGFKNIFQGGLGFVGVLTQLLNSILYVVSHLFYILPNAICAFAFMKLTASKQRRKPAAAPAAPVEAE